MLSSFSRKDFWARLDVFLNALEKSDKKTSKALNMGQSFSCFKLRRRRKANRQRLACLNLIQIILFRGIIAVSFVERFSHFILNLLLLKFLRVSLVQWIDQFNSTLKRYRNLAFLQHFVGYCLGSVVIIGLRMRTFLPALSAHELFIISENCFFRHKRMTKSKQLLYSEATGRKAASGRAP